MLGLFHRDTPLSLRGLKLYSVSPIGDPRCLDRAALVEGLLSTSQEFFGSVPQKFSIDGPGGTSKGTTVGIKAFRNKLSKRGHADYYAVSSGLEDPFGFHCFFMQERAMQSGWDELVVWFDFRAYVSEVLHVARRLMSFFPANYGYVNDYPGGCLVPWEARPKTTFWSYRWKRNPEHTSWTSRIPSVLDGRVRDIYRYNFLNAAQVDLLRSLAFPEPVPFANDVSVLELTDDAVFEACTARYKSIVPAA